MRALAEAHGIRPSKSLGQNFLLDANLARAIARDAEVGPGVRVVEIGAGLGSLTVALADAGADRVLAIEFDRSLLPGLREAVGDRSSIEIVHADATKLDWPATLGDGAWVCCGNLPYNVGTTIVLDVLERAPTVARIVVMLQREVADRLAATPEQREAYGAVSLRVAYRARADLIRTVPPEVFWPRPKVGSAIVRLDRLDVPPVDVDEGRLWSVVDTAFAERRKTMRNALRRLGLTADEAGSTLATAGVEPTARPETLDLAAFARVTEALPT
ncbi:MAG: 16S rRNA (adenine(1518)-N(6)/adenine(1519)-N(6))-dimethyltransferase RsmA [Actinomycetota bacterium]